MNTNTIFSLTFEKEDIFIRGSHSKFDLIAFHNFIKFINDSGLKINQLILGADEKEFLSISTTNLDGVVWPSIVLIKKYCRKHKIKIQWRKEKSIVGFR